MLTCNHTGPEPDLEEGILEGLSLELGRHIVQGLVPKVERHIVRALALTEEHHIVRVLNLEQALHIALELGPVEEHLAVLAEGLHTDPELNPMEVRHSQAVDLEVERHSPEVAAATVATTATLAAVVAT